MPSKESLMVKQMLSATLANQTQEFNLEAARQGLEALPAFTPVAPDVKVEKITVEGIPAPNACAWVVFPGAFLSYIYANLSPTPQPIAALPH